MMCQGLLALLIAVACFSTGSSSETSDEGQSCGEADILFILDSSSNVGENYNLVLDFAADLTSGFTIGSSAVQFAALVFSSHYNNVFGFSKYHEMSALQMGIRNLPFYGSKAITSAALQSARIFSFTSTNGARQNVSKIAVVITDSKSVNGTEIPTEAYLLKMSGVTVYSIGVGSETTQLELNSIATSPSHTFSIPDYNDLDSIKAYFEDEVCRETKKEVDTGCISTSCLGRVDGNYSACDPECRQGYYYSCVNEFAYKMPCELGSYVNSDGNDFLARKVYNPLKGSCELESDNCPRTASDYMEIQQRSEVAVPAAPAPYRSCLSASDTCSRRPNGNYPQCYPDCQSGFYYTCSNYEIYEMPCPMDWYTDNNNNRYLARMVYDVVSDSCISSASFCPRDPKMSVSPGPGTVGQSGEADDVTTELCEGKADILLIMDSSGSIGKLNFEIEKQFVADITSQFSMGPDAFHFAALSFSDSVVNLFGFNKYTANSAVRQGILDASYLGGGTDAASAFTIARNYFFSIYDGARADVPKYAVVVTDGVSQDPTRTAEEAKKLKKSGVTLMAIGVGSQVRKPELKAIASSPNYIFTFKDFSVLGHLRKSLIKKLCEKKVYQASCVQDSCRGKPDGNYPFCYPECQDGYYYSCVNEFAYKMPCALGWYTNENGDRYTARMIYDPSSDSCELESDSCPRGPVVTQTTTTPVSTTTTTTPVTTTTTTPTTTTTTTTPVTTTTSTPTTTPVTTTTTPVTTTTTPTTTTTTTTPVPTTTTPVTSTSAPVPSPCMNKCDSCSGRSNGNYAMCYPDCQSGDYYNCSNGEKYIMPCPFGWYTDENNKPFLAKMIYKPSTDTCELTAEYCPGGSEVEPEEETDNEDDQCPALVDVIFALDSSGSISLSNYSLQLEFVVNLVRRFQIGPEDARFGAVVFSYYGERLFDLNTFDNHESLAAAVRATEYKGSSTHTNRGLDKINYGKMFSTDKGGRDNARDVVIVITDGRSSRPSHTLKAANRLKDLDVEIMTVGIADADDAELQRIVSKPSYFFKAADFTALTNIEAELTKRTCEVVPTCRGQADILFLLDSSGSIGSTNFETLKTFVASLTQSFTVGPLDIQFGAISYSSKVHNIFSFNTCQTNSEVWQALLNSTYISGGTNTAQALHDAQTFYSTTTHGARSGVGKVAIVVTDGYSDNAVQTAMQADLLKNKDVTVLAIGVGDFGPNELHAIASSPSHVFSVHSYDVLKVIRSGVVTTACQSQQRQNFCVSLSCKGRPNGNYSACSPECKEGHYYSCFNEHKYKQHCDFGRYLHPYSNNSYYTARKVYNPVTNTCEQAVGSCPRNPINYMS